MWNHFIFILFYVDFPHFLFSSSYAQMPRDYKPKGNRDIRMTEFCRISWEILISDGYTADVLVSRDNPVRRYPADIRCPNIGFSALVKGKPSP